MSANKTDFHLPDTVDKADYVQKNFDEIADQYDRFNDLFTFGMHRLWKRKTIKAVDAKSAATALDLCCGSGDLAILSAKANPAIQVVAADFSPQMLSVLTRRIAGVDFKDRIEVRKEDATQLPASFTNQFDIVTTGYGVRNVTNRHQCFSEVFRSLKPNGRYGILEVGSIRPKFIEPIAVFFMKYIIPRIGYLLQGQKHEMYDYLPHSAFAFPEPEVIVEELAQVGFQNIRFQRLFFGASILYVATKPA